MKDKDFLSEAIAMAVGNTRQGGGPFGALVVKDGEIVGKGVNQVIETGDPTAHAEVVAIRDACRKTGNFRLDGCVIYTSCEPCPMCLGAIYWAHINRIVFAATKNDAQGAGFDDSFIYDEMILGLEHRSIPITRIETGNALEPFEHWIRLENKTRY